MESFMKGPFFAQIAPYGSLTVICSPFCIPCVSVIWTFRLYSAWFFSCFLFPALFCSLFVVFSWFVLCLFPGMSCLSLPLVYINPRVSCVLCQILSIIGCVVGVLISSPVSPCLCSLCIDCCLFQITAFGSYSSSSLSSH